MDSVPRLIWLCLSNKDAARHWEPPNDSQWFIWSLLIPIYLSLNNNLDFYKQLNLYFPEIIDIKYVCQNLDRLKFMGLSSLANEIGVNKTFFWYW